MANPNPSPETRIKPGQVLNPGGKTSAHRKAEVKAAELAAEIQLELITALKSVLSTTEQDEVKLGAVRADILRLLKDSQDRGFGAPTQPVDNTSSDGSARLPSRIILVGPDDGDCA